ncbi:MULTISPECIES: hypothetical protein [Bacillus]|uniref:hypothetical protein n=1 Tax=Bacillus TaxID=1386 RepID=UPI000C785A7B|nr:MULTISPECIES: hypothetical protein [Bacillus]MCP1159322.1 hypothetical protein [Bacillus infantis]PLR72211.1 hypothetical protein CYJ37_11695 [Bacillus sp. UMB0728]
MALTKDQIRMLNFSYHKVGKVVPNSGVSQDYISGFQEGILDTLLILGISIPDTLGVDDPRD